MSAPVAAVRALSSAVWHIPVHQPSGRGVWTLCGLGWPEDNYFASRIEKAGCKRCLIVAASAERAVVSVGQNE